jgi:peptidyl-prolyl cis-trans isomerase SurA
MTRQEKNQKALWLSVAACILVLSGIAHAASTYSDRIVAVVNGDVILESDLQKHKHPATRGMFALPLGVVPPGKWPTEKELLDELVVIKLLEQEAAKKNVTVDDKNVDASIDSIRKRNNLTQDQFAVSLANSGVNYADYRSMMKRQLTLSRLISAEVMQKVPLNENDAQLYFKKNRDQIDEEFKKLLDSQAPARPPQEEPKMEIPTHEEVHIGGTVRLQQISLHMPKGAKKQDVEKVLATAKKVYQEAMTGADFGKLAQQYSQDPLAKKGGDLGPMKYNDLRPELQKVVQHMKPGLVTPPMRGPEGIMILYLADAKNRTTKKVPIPPQLRKQYEKHFAELKKKQEAEKQKQEEAAKSAKEAEESEVEDTSSETDKSKVTNKVLTPEEFKEYKKQRKKVISVMRTDKIQARMKEWLEELKKNSIIEVKL